MVFQHCGKRPVAHMGHPRAITEATRPRLFSDTISFRLPACHTTAHCKTLQGYTAPVAGCSRNAPFDAKRRVGLLPGSHSHSMVMPSSRSMPCPFHSPHLPTSPHISLRWLAQASYLSRFRVHAEHVRSTRPSEITSEITSEIARPRARLRPLRHRSRRPR